MIFHYSSASPGADQRPNFAPNPIFMAGRKNRSE
jgi:hypothetical protein